MRSTNPASRIGSRSVHILAVASMAILVGGSAGAATGPVSTSAHVTSGPPPNAVQSRLNALVIEDGMPGALAAVSARNGRVRNYTAGVGDLTTGAPVPVDGHVRIASNTKTFTAVTVLQLVGEGKVDLDAKVDAYLPGLLRRNGNDGRRITVRHLLQQTSGLPDYDEDLPQPLSEAARTYLSPRTLLDNALSHRSHFAPGKRWEYSNTNYVVAGLIVERVTGRPISEEIARRIIRPLGLAHTYWPAPGVLSIRAPHPKGYFAAAPGNPWQDITAFEPSVGWAAGALISTPSDLLHFFHAVVAGKLLAPAEQRQMMRTVPAPGFEPTANWSYGLGIARRGLPCGGYGWGHGGDYPGYETRGLVRSDGRGAAIAVTALPTSLEPLRHLNEAVESAVCMS